MSLGLLCAVVAALCYGVASVLQSVGARSTASVETLDPRLVVRLLRSGPYVLGWVLDILGFLFGLVAVRSLPLFVVQAVVASSVAVTAILSVLVLHLRLHRPEVAAIVVVVAGLVALGIAGGPDRAEPVGTVFRLTLLASSVLLGAAAAAAARLPAARSVGPLGVLAGLGYGVVAIAARIMPDPTDVGALLTDASAYALVVAGLVATLAFAVALQRGSVTTATALLTVAETVVPALVGVLFLGDQARSGLAWLAIAGFVAAVAGAVALARFGEVSDEPDAATTTRAGASQV